MPVLLVRHAHALARSDWDGDDDERPLSVKGAMQARLLVDTLLPFAPTEVRSSPSVRCLDTVRPLAEAAAVELVMEDLLAEGSGPAAADLVRELSAGAAVLCSHGDVIPDVLAVISRKDGLGLGRLPKSEKGSVWVLDGDGRRISSARYIGPPKAR